MLIGKMQNAADLERFLHIPADKLEPIIKDSPEHVMDVMVPVMESLCFKMDIPAKHRAECVRKVRERKVGYLFENMEKFSIQEERRKTEEQRQRAETAEAELRAAKRFYYHVMYNRPSPRDTPSGRQPSYSREQTLLNERRIDIIKFTGNLHPNPAAANGNLSD